MRCFSVLLLLLVQLWASDIPVASSAVYVDFARGASWGALNNQWIYSPIEPDEGACVSVWNNNPTSAHTFQLSAWGSFDQGAHSFSSAGKWAQLPVFEGNGTAVSQSGVTATTLTVQPLGSVVVYYRAGGAARVALRVAGGALGSGTPDTADILMTRANNSGVCGNISLEPQARNSCSNTSTFTFTDTSVTQIVPPSVSGGAIHVCSLVLNNLAGANSTAAFYATQGVNQKAISGNIASNAGTITPLQTSFGELFSTPLGWSFAGSWQPSNQVVVTYAVY